MFGIGKKKCEYCRKAVDGEGITRAVKKPGYVGTFQKSFCSEEHAGSYTKEAAPQKKGGCCR